MNSVVSFVLLQDYAPRIKAVDNRFNPLIPVILFLAKSKHYSKYNLVQLSIRIKDRCIGSFNCSVLAGGYC